MIALWKKLYETPLESLERLRGANESFKEERLSYAGRLDPMAEGVMPVMVGDECSQRDIFLGFDKYYEADVIFGISTDSLDLLGVVTDIAHVPDIFKAQIETAIRPFIGTIEQMLPFFSSKAIASGLDRVRTGTAPVHKKIVQVKKIDITGISTKTIQDIASQAIVATEKVIGDFRQADIKKSWEDTLKKNPTSTALIVTLKIESGTGFYVRAFARDLGEVLGVPACVLRLVRTRAGDWEKKDCII
jgi:tRNA pseudouridine55 synthase